MQPVNVTQRSRPISSRIAGGRRHERTPAFLRFRAPRRPSDRYREIPRSTALARRDARSAKRRALDRSFEPATPGMRHADLELAGATNRLAASGSWAMTMRAVPSPFRPANSAMTSVPVAGSSAPAGSPAGTTAGSPASAWTCSAVDRRDRRGLWRPAARLLLPLVRVRISACAATATATRVAPHGRGPGAAHPAGAWRPPFP